MDRTTRWFVGIGVGTGVAFVSYTWLVPNLLLAATDAVLYSAGSALLIRHQQVWRGLDTEGLDPWAATAGPLVIIVGVFGLNVELGLRFGLRTGLLVLAVGAMLAAWSIGVGSALHWAGVDIADGATESGPTTPR